MRPPLLRVALAGIIAAVSGCESPSAPRVPAAIEALSTVEQSVTVNGTVPQAPSVRVTTSRGEPVPDVAVTFASAGEGAVLTGFTQKTNADGVASLTSWSIGSRAQQYTVTAKVDAQSSLTVQFRTEGLPDRAVRLALLTEPASITSGVGPLSPQPVVQLADTHGNAVPQAGVAVRAVVDGTGAELSNADAVTGPDGAARFGALALGGTPGEYRLRFEAAGYAAVSAETATHIVEDGCRTTTPLDLQLGELKRLTGAAESSPLCLDFDALRHNGQQFMLLLENSSLFGSSDAGFFPGPVADTAFGYALVSFARQGGGAVREAGGPVVAPPPRAVNGWDFGSGPIYEVEPEMPAGGVDEPLILGPGGKLTPMRGATAAPVVGDTIVVRIEGIPRLSITSGAQKVVVRHVSPHLVIAEDSRLGTLTRENSRTNTPLTQATMDAIAAEYAAGAAVQGDLLFEGRHNNLVESDPDRRIIAVHSLMYADNIWGYTYSSGNYFVFDYWAGTDGATPGHNQQPQRVADNLFMHEVAHMRHWGMLERRGSPPPPRGNRWLVEGFARFTERLPVAARLLGSTTPSRTGNVVLPTNPVFAGAAFRDDVPTFLHAGSSFYGGYSQSSWVFDYFADHVTARGQDWRVALREFVVAAGAVTTLDAATSTWLPGLTFTDLVTRARLALYLDDIGTSGLPQWTQYLQYQLRASRPAGTAAASDPRLAWPALQPGAAIQLSGSVVSGGARGFVIDGTSQPASARFQLTIPSSGNAVVSVMRVR